MDATPIDMGNYEQAYYKQGSDDKDAQWLAAVDELMDRIGDEKPVGGSTAYEYLEELKFMMQMKEA